MPQKPTTTVRRVRGQNVCDVRPGRYANTYDVWLYLTELPDKAWVEEFNHVASGADVAVRFQEHEGTPAVAVSEAEDSHIEEIVLTADRIIDGANKRRERRAREEAEEQRRQEARNAEARAVAERINRIA